MSVYFWSNKSLPYNNSICQLSVSIVMCVGWMHESKPTNGRGLCAVCCTFIVADTFLILLQVNRNMQGLIQNNREVSVGRQKTANYSVHACPLSCIPFMNPQSLCDLLLLMFFLKKLTNSTQKYIFPHLWLPLIYISFEWKLYSRTIFNGNYRTIFEPFIRRKNLTMIFHSISI